MNDSYRNYLLDVMRELIDDARKAGVEARKAEAAADPAEAAFRRGRATAYYEVVSHMLGQLEAFDIERASVGVDAAFEPDRELL